MKGLRHGAEMSIAGGCTTVRPFIYVYIYIHLDTSWMGPPRGGNTVVTWTQLLVHAR